MARFSDEWLRQLLDRSDIVEVIGQYLPLTKKGARFWVPCPWHAEKNPSFCVSPDRQMFYCFSCKRGGGVIQFVMEYEKLTFMEAVSMLAERAGMELPAAEDNADYRRKREYKKRLTGMMREAALYFNQMLKTPEGAAAREYLQKRQVHAQVARFGLGYAPGGSSLHKYLTEKGYTLKEQLDAGLVKQKEGRVYDAFRDRVMFPIMNVMGEVIAFGGRVLGEGEPKYLNSSETLLFNKRYHLYGLSIVKKQRDLKRVLLVEGYMDVVSMAGAGVKNAVASLGTSLTREQALLLKRYVKDVYLCYDGDNAGVNAALRGVDVLAQEGLQVHVILLPDGMDPDDFMKKHGRVAFNELAKKAMGPTEFKLDRLRTGFDLRDPDQAVQYATQAAALLSKLDNELEKERFARLVAVQTGLSEQSVRAQIGHMPEKRYNLPEKETHFIAKEPEDDEAKLIALLMECPDVLANMEDVVAEDFEDAGYREIFLYVQGQIKKGILPTCAEIVSVFSAAPDKLGGLLGAELPPGAASRQAYAGMLLTHMRTRNKKQELSELLRQSEQATNPQVRAELLRQIQTVNAEIRAMRSAELRRRE